MSNFDMEEKKYIELLISMSTDAIIGNISKGAFISNLKTILEKLSQDKEDNI